LVYRMEQSTDLVAWTPLVVLTNQTGSVIWTNSAPVSELPFFIRASE